MSALVLYDAQYMSHRVLIKGEMFVGIASRSQ